jgi:hypothetical protein
MGKNIYTKNMYILKRGAHGSIAGWGTNATSWKVTGSSPDEVDSFL